MKKIIFFLLILFLSQNIFADSLNIQKIESLAKSEAEDIFEPVLDLIGTSLNVGIFAPVSGNIFSVGLQGNFIKLNKQGVLEDAGTDYLIAPYLYAGVRIPLVGLNFFARGYKEKYATLFGIGGGWEKDFLVILNWKFLLHYHFIKDIYLIEGDSFGGSIIVSLTKIPAITPFASMGLHHIALKTPRINVLHESIDFSMSKIGAKGGLGVKFLKIIIAELNIFPIPIASLSLGLSF